MLRHADNWYPYAGDTTLLLNGVYSETAGVTFVEDPDPNVTGQVISIGDGGSDLVTALRYPLPTFATTCGMAQRIWLNTLSATGGLGQVPMSFSDAGNTKLFSLFVETTGRLSVKQGNSRLTWTNLATTSAPVVTANAWWHIEMKVVISPTIGSIEVRVEGVPVITLTNINTGSTSIAQVAQSNAVSGSGESYSYEVKDYVVWDGTGTKNTDFLGSVVVYTKLPDSDVSFNWGTTGLNGFSVLDNAPPLDDVAYIFADYPAIPAPSVFGLSSLPSNVTSVKGLISWTRAKKVDGGDGNLQTSLVSGASTGDGADRPITAAYTYWRDVFETDPATSDNWTVSAANLVNMKVNRTV